MTNSLDFWRNNWVNPWRDSGLTRSVDRLFEDLALARGTRRESGDVALVPVCEVVETKKDYLVKFDVPGLSKDAFKLDFHDSCLTVSGERKAEKSGAESEGQKRHFSEVSYGAFSRSFTFPTQVDAEKIEASYENGVLQVTLPKSEATRARQITIR